MLNTKIAIQSDIQKRGAERQDILIARKTNVSDQHYFQESDQTQALLW